MSANERQRYLEERQYGRRITQKGTTELEIVDGKIVRETSFQDRDSFIKQVEAPRGSKKYE